MDQDARISRLKELQSAQRSLHEHLLAHQAKVAGHHPTREGARELLHAEKALRRAEKQQRSVDRALRNELKQHSVSHVAAAPRRWRTGSM